MFGGVGGVTLIRGGGCDGGDGGAIGRGVSQPRNLDDRILGFSFKVGCIFSSGQGFIFSFLGHGGGKVGLGES